ncbi:lipid A deacylase LpxR family protein [Desulfovibrio sp. OttesenSCG-928-C06]|nr:lipid A deacylase LpxR family protein [Desulfovibrio sp. OttesenSCG-928-C06]
MTSILSCAAIRPFLKILSVTALMFGLLLVLAPGQNALAAEQSMQPIQTEQPTQAKQPTQIALQESDANSAQQQEATEELLSEGPTLLIYFENDLFYNEDRYYTNAVQMRLISRDLATLAHNRILPDGLSDLLGDLPMPGSANATRYNLSFGFGQHIYTPKDTDSKELQKDDRPYAGYLYGSFGLHAKQESRLDTLELAIGIVGPSALGEQAQNEVHRFRNIDTAEGWAHQLKDEPTMMLTWTRIWRINSSLGSGAWGMDFLPRFEVSAGTPFTRAGLGGELRIGWNLPQDFGVSLIRPGAGITAPAVPGEEDYQRSKGNGFWDDVSVYVFAGADAKAVAWDTFLDGNAWKNSHSIDKFPLVAELSTGITMHLGRFRIGYTHVYKSLEFHGQEKWHNYGSIHAGYTF